MVILIAAAGQNNALGKDNSMVWHLPDDFKRFKLLTSGHYIIMGRKTFESLKQPLPHRTHVVVTRQKDYQCENCIVAQSIEEAIEKSPKGEDVFVIGGGEIYQLALPYADKIELTRVNSSFEADTFFPEINLSEWGMTNEIFHEKDAAHKFDFSYQTYMRK